MNTYLIPANAKTGKLIFGVFRRFDLILFISGIVVSILLLMIVGPDNLVQALICLAPVGICSLLVVPVPNYHNILIVLTELVMFYYQRRNYKWKGWCYKDEFK